MAAKNLERSTYLKNIKEISMDKKLLISNIKLGILNMYEYVIGRAVILPGDKKTKSGETLNQVRGFNSSSHNKLTRVCWSNLLPS